jgi:hypothetical protein
MIVRVVGAGYLFFREADSFNNPVKFAPALRLCLIVKAQKCRSDRQWQKYRYVYRQIYK